MSISYSHAHLDWGGKICAHALLYVLCSCMYLSPLKSLYRRILSQSIRSRLTFMSADLFLSNRYELSSVSLSSRCLGSAI